MNKRDIELQKKYDLLNERMGIVNTYKLKEENKLKEKERQLKNKKKKLKNLEKIKNKNKDISELRNSLNELSYNELLKQPQWKEKRLQIFKRDKFVCLICNSKNELNVHHRLYVSFRLPWEYKNNCFATLCRKCHETIHKEPVNMKIMEYELTDKIGTPNKKLPKK